jgi:tetratricopeptide (TPR) repeat protein
VKLFISYSREDAGDFAKHVHRYLMNSGYDVFIDVNNITIGDPWAHSIEQNISNCDVFLVILTPDALRSNYVENEILQAQRDNKIIVPCISEDVAYNNIKWGLDKIQGIEFINEYQLTRKLYSKIKSYENRLSGNNDKVPNLNATESISIKPDSDRLKESNDPIQPPKLDNTSYKPRNKYFKSAEKFEEFGLSEKAIEMYDVVLKNEPENFDALFKKSLVLAKLAKYDQAIEFLEHALNINPAHPDIWYHRGCFLEEIERYDDALKSFDIDLKIDKQDVNSSIGKARILEKIGRNEEFRCT